jgi:glycosyltransferase involved in cell wall biosynthesis
MKLSIVIPAYNEEDAIGQTIRRTLEAEENITNHSPVSEIEVIVVSDGSTDRTVEIASEYENVKTIVFEKNRGYGAAIKEGFNQSSGDILGFLDADGTCDPNFFAELCSALQDEKADIAIGSRMGPDSKMPSVRRIGNKM